MCTVVCRWHPDEPFPVQILALRDELLSRSFDAPAAWWPDHPGVIGGRDRTAGGSWCVSDVARGVTAVVLNRPERMTAEVGAPSRGILPLLATEHGERWPDVLDVAGMASFNVVLATPDSLRWWWFDGSSLERQDLSPGTHLFTPRGMATGQLDPRFSVAGARLLAGEEPSGTHGDTGNAAPTDVVWPGWLAVLREARPSEDPSNLIVRRRHGEDSYETVFGQFIAARAGMLRLDHLQHPADGTARPWTTEVFQG